MGGGFEKARLGIYTRVDLFAGKPLARLLDVLSALRIEPTHWGEAEPARQPFDRRAVLRARKPLAIVLVRSKAPTSSIYINKRDELFSFEMEWGKLTAKQAELPYRTGEALAERLDPVFGFVQPVFRGVGALWNLAANQGVKSFLEAGPIGVCSRTWFGPELIELFGVDRLRDAPAVVSDARGDGIRLDLLDTPWAAAPAALAAAQKKVMTRLRAARVFADYSGFKPEARSGWKRPASGGPTGRRSK